MKLVLRIACAATLLPLPLWAQVPDTLRSSVQEEAIAEEAPMALGKAAKERDRREQLLLRRSRRERTLVKIGYQSNGAYRGSGLLLLRDPRPVVEQIHIHSLLVGVDQKLSPAWAVHAAAAWQFSGSSRYVSYQPAGWQGNVGVDYYFGLPKALREGKTADNFFYNRYITLEGWLPVADRLTYQENGVEHSVTANAYRRAVSLGVGVHSNRTRLFYYNTALSVGYLFGRDPGLRHAVQPMARFSLGFGL